jgi:hypothetical protein
MASGSQYSCCVASGAREEKWSVVTPNLISSRFRPTGDHYAAGFNTSMFNAAGITYRNSDRNRSDIYADALPLFNSGRVRLLDNRRLVQQFASLERKTSAMGRDVINHPPGGHDDVCNAAAGALVSASAMDRRPKLLFG